MRRSRVHLLLVWTLAAWQAVLLAVCVPTASAHRAPEPAAHGCCERPEPAKPDLACPHCSDGHGRFVDAATPPVPLAPTTLVDRVSIEPIDAEPVATLPDERPVYRPPDPSLFALRCALIR